MGSLKFSNQGVFTLFETHPPFPCPQLVGQFDFAVDSLIEEINDLKDIIN